MNKIPEIVKILKNIKVNSKDWQEVIDRATNDLEFVSKAIEDGMIVENENEFSKSK